MSWFIGFLIVFTAVSLIYNIRLLTENRTLEVHLKHFREAYSEAYSALRDYRAEENRIYKLAKQVEAKDERS